MKATARYLVLLSMLVVGCGGSDDGDGGGGGKDTDSLPETIECGDTSCKRATQYCATIVNATTTHLCLDKPASCKSCDCVNLDTDLTAQTGRQDCTETATVDVTFTCACYDDVDYIKTSCTARSRPR